MLIDHLRGLFVGTSEKVWNFLPKLVAWARRNSEWLVFLAIVTVLLAVVMFSFARFLAVETEAPSGTTLVGLVRQDDLPHSGHLVIDVSPGSTTVSCTLKVNHSRAAAMAVALPGEGTDVRGANLGFLDDPAFTSRLTPSDQATKASIDQFKTGFASGPSTRDILSSKDVLNQISADLEVIRLIDRAASFGFTYVVPKSADPNPAFVRFNWRSAIRRHGFAGRLLLITVENPGVPADLGTFEALEDVQIFLTPEVTVTTFPTDARLTFTSKGAPIITTPLTNGLQAIQVGWTDDRAESGRQFWILLAGVTIGVLGGLLSGFMFGPPRWKPGGQER